MSYTLVLAANSTQFQLWLAALSHDRRRALRPYLLHDGTPLIGRRSGNLLILDFPSWWTKRDGYNLLLATQHGLHTLDYPPPTAQEEPPPMPKPISGLRDAVEACRTSCSRLDAALSMAETGLCTRMEALSLVVVALAKDVEVLSDVLINSRLEATL